MRKPPGVSSHKCVLAVRKLFRTRRVGHAGTLDPMATGVLTMALGSATKFLQVRAWCGRALRSAAAGAADTAPTRHTQYLTSDKEYNGVIRFGVTTNSDDVTGCGRLRDHLRIC